jgi:hypothetical protein
MYARRMKLILIAVLVLGCGKSVKEELEEEARKDIARTPKPEVKDTPKKDVPPPAAKKVEEPEPDPTTPEEIDAARKKAMIAGRDKDVIRFCELGKIDENSDPQASLGCTLAACRIMQADKAQAWAKGLRKNAKDKPLLEQAIKTCMANKVTL